MYSAKVICDSISKEGVRLTTMELSYPRFIHSQFMTHRMFSRSSSSSRAIPVQKMIDQVRENPAMPIHWGENQSGMQAGEEIKQIEGVGGIRHWWREVANNITDEVHEMNVCLGLHKQVLNRLLEPFQWIKVIVTATEFDNFFNLRLGHATQPEMQHIAKLMKDAMDGSIPSEISIKEPISWHLPYIGIKDIAKHEIGLLSKEDLRNISAARCARVSYLNHDNTEPDIEKDLKLAMLLLSEWHMSPFEHQAMPMKTDIFDTTPEYWEFGVTHMDGDRNLWSNNFKGWVQYRALLER